MRWLKSVFTKEKEEQAVVTVRLENAPRWLQGQLRDTLAIHLGRFDTAIVPVEESLKEAHDLLVQLQEADVSVDDYPDASIAVKKRKQEVCALWKRHLDEFGLALSQKHTDVQEYVEAISFMNEQIDQLDHALRTQSDTVRRYFPLLYNEWFHAFEQLQKAVSVINDIADDGLIRQLNDFYTHHTHLLQKLSLKEKHEETLVTLQQKIDIQYKEFLRFQTKIDNIKESKRYALEKESRTSASSFSIMKQEIQELDRRKKRVEAKLHELQSKKQATQKQITQLAISQHTKRMEALLQNISSYHVELII